MRKFILGIYPVFLLLVTIFSYVFVDPNLIYLKNLYSGIFITNRLLVTSIYISIIIIFFIFYSLFLYWFRKKTLALKEFKYILACTVGLLFLSYPAMVSFDIFNYIATSKVLFLYHENPYIIMPIQFLHDPLLLFMHAGNKVALYAPVWIAITGIPFLLSFGNFIITLFAFKLLNVFFYLSTIYVIYKLSKNVFYLSFFALNPLVIFETLVGSHNDIVMMFFAIISLYFIKNKKVALSVLFIILSILIKYSTVFLLPVILYIIYLQIRKKTVYWEKIFYYSSVSMFIIFLLSPIREEIYPWYAVWFLVFIPLISNRVMKYIYLALSFGLLFRYVPFMFLGTYFGPTSLIKILVTFIPVLIVIITLLARKWYIKYT